MVRHVLKTAIESILGSRLAAAATTPLRRARRLILAYHDVSAMTRPVGGDASLHLALDAFKAQLDEIGRLDLPVVPLSDSERFADSHVVITFDDACAGAVQCGVDELSSRRLPATIFVAPGLLGCASPWWDRLADLNTGAVPPSHREDGLTRYRGLQEEVLSGAAASRWVVQPPISRCRIATTDELSAAIEAHPGLTLGGHSWGHPNLSMLVGRELDSELRDTLSWLRNRWPQRTVPWLAYPYGLESPGVRAATRDAGYSGALLISGGWHRIREPRDVFGTPRLNVSSGLSLRGFRARLSGLFRS